MSLRRIIAITGSIAAVSTAVLAVSVPSGDADGPTQWQPLIAGTVLEVAVGGRAGVPADAVAATLNVTAVEPWADGYLTVFPCGEDVPTASNLNFRRDERAVPNAVMARLGTAGRVCLTSSATTSVIVDLAGYVPAGSPISPLPSPRRLVDTRDGTGAPVGRSGPGVLTVQVAGRPGVPVGARAAVLNVTVVEPDGPGFATVFPCNQPQPVASNINFGTGDVRPNLVVAGLDPEGRTCVFTTGSTHVVIDAIAAVTAGAGLQLVANPERVLDTRIGLGAPAGRVQAAQPLAVAIAGRATVAAGASSVVLNVTATGSTSGGFVTAYPCGSLPAVSNLNHAPGQTIANLVVAGLDSEGRICLYTNVGTDLVVDVAGWFDGTTAHRVLPSPQRLYDSRVVQVIPPSPPLPSVLPPSLTTPIVTFPQVTLPVFFPPATTSPPVTTTTVPAPSIDTSAPCDVLVYPVRNGGIVVRDLITGVEIAASDTWFVDGERPIVSNDCTGVLVAGPSDLGPWAFSVRYYGFDGTVYEVGEVTGSSRTPVTILDELDDGRVLASGSYGTWDVGADVRLVAPTDAFQQGVGAAHDGSVAVMAGAILFDHSMSVYSLSTGALIRTTTLPAHRGDPMPSPNGTLIAVGTNPAGSPHPPTRTTPAIRSLDGTLEATYPLGEVAEVVEMNWISDIEVIVCVANEPPAIWTIGGGVVSTGVAPKGGCPTGG